jgi:hypothetical protein
VPAHKQILAANEAGFGRDWVINGFISTMNPTSKITAANIVAPIPGENSGLNVVNEARYGRIAPNRISWFLA